jgi:beta-glucanase (GH16 family)
MRAFFAFVFAQWLWLRYALVSLLRWRRRLVPEGKLLFVEEFAAPLSPLIWRDAYYWGRTQLAKRELQWFTPGSENHQHLTDSVIGLQVRKKPTHGLDGNGDPKCYPFSAALLSSGDSFRFRYGRVQVRARFPHAPNTEAAIWLLGRSGLPAIDIAHCSDEWPRHVRTGHHFGSSFEAPDAKNRHQRAFCADSPRTDFHVFELEWRPNYLAWFIDGWLVNEQTQHVPSEELYLVLQACVRNDEARGNRLNPVRFPVSFELDWVRVYDLG